jgi:Cu/Ag efflux protein CusF
MKKALAMVVAMVAMVSMVAMVPVWAADVEGKVQRVSPSDRTIVLDDGTTLWVAEGMAIENLKEGTKVKASYEQRDGRNVVTNIEVAD